MVDAAQIQEILPHRYPFLLVDRILELEENVRAVGIKNVSINEEFFQGHFPGRPIMPGVLILEAMAQVGGVMLLVSSDNKGKLALFGGADHVRWRKAVVPGDQLVMECKMLRSRGDMGRVEAVARVNGEIVAEAELTFVLRPPVEAAK